MLRERDYLARQGYVTLHIDYRNHAQSDTDPRNDANLRAGYTVDAINAGLALKKAQVVDPSRIAIIGRSMGGGVVYNVAGRTPGALPRGRGLRAGELRQRRQLRQVGAARRVPVGRGAGRHRRGSAPRRRTRRRGRRRAPAPTSAASPSRSSSTTARPTRTARSRGRASRSPP